MPNSSDEILEMLIKNELAVSQLYQQFSEVFVEDSGFWRELSQQEQMHAKWIAELREQLAQKDMRIGITSFRAEAAGTFVKYVGSLINKCKKGEVSRLKAYALAYDIENSLLERKFFTVFPMGSAAFQGVHDQLVRATETHRQAIGARLSAIKSGKKG